MVMVAMTVVMRMIVVMVMAVTVGMAMVSAAPVIMAHRAAHAIGPDLWPEGFLLCADLCPQLAQHRFEHMISTDDQAASLDLAGCVAIADVPCIARQICPAHLEHGFVRGNDLDLAPVLQLEPPDQIKVGHLWQIDQKTGAVCRDQPFAPHDAFVIGQHNDIIAGILRGFDQMLGGGKFGHLWSLGKNVERLHSSRVCLTKRRQAGGRGATHGGIMHKDSLAEELADIQRQLAYLHQRERLLQEALFRADGVPPALRPGWPIRRMGRDAFH